MYFYNIFFYYKNKIKHLKIQIKEPHTQDYLSERNGSIVNKTYE